MKDSMNKQRTLFIVTIIILLGIIGFLLVNNSQKTQLTQQQAQELDEAEKLRIDLENQYFEAISELEAQRGTNEELNAMIERQKQELLAQKNQITQLLNTRSELNKARQQIAEMKINIDRYLTEIRDLKEMNQLLTEENVQLQSKTTQLSQEIEKVQQEKMALDSEKTTISSEKEKLEKTNINLAKKVTKASVIPATNIVATTLQVTDRGKEKKKSKAGSVDRLKICFTVGENNIVDSGYERYYIRIIGPDGVTLGSEADGSGSFNSSEDNSTIRYTLIKEFDYANTKQDICTNWDKEGPFSKGNYKIEIYNKGYLAGSGSFKLK